MGSKVEGVQKRVPRLEPGAVLAKPVYSPKGSRLFDEKKELTESDISRLKKWDIRYVYICPEKEPETSDQTAHPQAS